MYMNKKQLVDKIAEEQNITKVAAEENLTNILQCIMEGTVEDGELSVQGFGGFKVKTVGERNGTNPATGQPIKIPEHQKIVFKPGSVFRSSL